MATIETVRVGKGQGKNRREVVVNVGAQEQTYIDNGYKVVDEKPAVEEDRKEDE